MSFLANGKKPVIFSDFDGTITERDVIVMIMEAFAPPEWKKIVHEIMETRTLSIREGVRRLFELIPGVKKDEIVSFVLDHVKLRPGFAEFLTYCRDADIPFIVVSGGVDFFIEPILAPYQALYPDITVKSPPIPLQGGTLLPGVKQDSSSVLKVYCNGAAFHEKTIELLTPYFKADCTACGQCACCKLSILDQYPPEVYFRIAIGDSLTDLAMGKAADRTFAREPLIRYMTAEQYPYTPYETFFDIQKTLSLSLTEMPSHVG